MSLAEIIEEGKRLPSAGGDDDGVEMMAQLECGAFWFEHGPRLLAVAEAGAKMRRCANDTRSMSCGEWDAALAEWDAAASGEKKP